MRKLEKIITFKIANNITKVISNLFLPKQKQNAFHFINKEMKSKTNFLFISLMRECQNRRSYIFDALSLNSDIILIKLCQILSTSLTHIPKNSQMRRNQAINFHKEDV